MANHISHAALPYPVKGARYTIAVPYLDADGDPTDPTTPDTERSIDGAAYADCSEEVSTITGSLGSGYITLTGDETDCSLLFVGAKAASGPKTTLAMLQPRVLPAVVSGTAQTGANGSITLASGTSTALDMTGCIVVTTGGTGGGGGSGKLGNQARVITAYSTSTKVATVVPNWETNPDNTTTYDIRLTEASILSYADLKAITGTAVSTSTAQLGVNAVNLGGTAQTGRDIGASVLLSSGTGTGQLDFTSGVVKANATQWVGGTIPAVSVTGVPLVDPHYWNGTVVATPGTAGVPSVDMIRIATDLVSTSTAQIGVNLVNISGAAVNTANAQIGANVVNWAGTAVSGSVISGSPAVNFLRRAVVVASTASTVTLDASASTVDNYYYGCSIVVALSLADPQSRVITAYNGTTKVATVSRNWDTNPTSSYIFIIYPASANVETWLGGAIPAPNVTGVPKVDLVDWLGSAPDALSSGKVPADLKLWLTAAPAALTANGYVQAMLLRWLTDNAGGTPSVLQSGRVDSYIGAIASGVIAAASFAVGALDAVWSTVIETGFTALQSTRLMLSALAGKLSGAATTTVTIRDVNDTVDRIVATVDADGDRLSVTKDVS